MESGFDPTGGPADLIPRAGGRGGSGSGCDPAGGPAGVNPQVGRRSGLIWIHRWVGGWRILVGIHRWAGGRAFESAGGPDSDDVWWSVTVHNREKCAKLNWNSSVTVHNRIKCAKLNCTIKWTVRNCAWYVHAPGNEGSCYMSIPRLHCNLYFLCM